MSIADNIECKLGAQTIFAAQHTGEICGSNGLPLAPKSISILGRSQMLKTMKHKHVTSYLDFIRGKHERLIIVAEYYEKNLRTKWFESEFDIVATAQQVLQALQFLNENGIVHRCLTQYNILFDDANNVKLFNYGLYHMTDCGRDVGFPIGHVKYLSPEDLFAVLDPKFNSSSKSDVWALGVILTETYFRKELWSNYKLSQCLRKVLTLVFCDDILSRFVRELDCLEEYQKIDPVLKNFLQTCLQVDCKKRPTPKELLNHNIFSTLKNNLITNFDNFKVSNRKTNHPLNNWELKELYYLWQLAGGDVHSELKRSGLIKNKAPILSIPSLFLLEGTTFGQDTDTAHSLDLSVVPLSLKTLAVRLKHINFEFYYPLIEIKHLNHCTKSEKNKMSEILPLIIRERDVEYQFNRVVLYKRLLEAYPYTRDKLTEQAKLDIPPLYRGEIWAAILNIRGDIEMHYTAIDKETPTTTDRQIEVDIPRCHQYNELLASKTGHLKLKRLLKSWVVSNNQYVYWQGLDSLCAPFLFLNFNNEALAYACFSAFIPKYLHNFFLKDNSAVIKEYLAKFTHLIAFHDPTLAKHLHEIVFIPELFAIPWFLTMFSHVFPLHKIFHLWDKLLLGDSSYPLFVGVSILQQQRDTLLASGFNECILLFSDLPEINIEECVTTASRMYEDTPTSITFRKNQTLPSDTNNFTITDEMLLEIQTELSPRLSVSDFLKILDNDGDKNTNFLTVDCRSMSMFTEKSIRGSINIPFELINFDKELLDGIPAGPELSMLMNNKGNLIVVLGEITSQAAQLCQYFVYADFPKVCQLNGDIDCLQYFGILAPSIL